MTCTIKAMMKVKLHRDHGRSKRSGVSVSGNDSRTKLVRFIDAELSLSLNLRHLNLSLSRSPVNSELSLSLDLRRTPSSLSRSIYCRALSLDLPISQLISSQALSSPYPSRARPNPSLPFLVELDRNGAQGIISQFLKHLGTPKLSGSLRLLHSFLEANPSLLCFSLSRFSLLCRSSSSLSLLTKTQGFFSSNATLALSPDLRRTPSLLCFGKITERSDFVESSLFDDHIEVLSY
ncbi:uncharacterized protein LOC108821866 [Raphanus sativus]|uniref:Uncharacterized protein LOC108821866 n=1 Tax=Raphanus sativus TaxID=3726 RepID=A0A9W3C5T1_RAPSA|nr:uncharacterized protein LOC108821866 [Raphanus sativus]